MIFQLRRNTVMSDWYYAMQHYYYVNGYNVNYVLMSMKTLETIVRYSNKKYDRYSDYLQITDGFKSVHDRRGNVIYTIRTEQVISFNGIQILIDNSIEDERMIVR